MISTGGINNRNLTLILIANDTILESGKITMVPKYERLHIALLEAISFQAFPLVSFCKEQ